MKIELPRVPGIREADGAAGQLSLDEPLRILALWMNMLLLLCGWICLSGYSLCGSELDEFSGYSLCWSEFGWICATRCLAGWEKTEHSTGSCSQRQRLQKFSFHRNAVFSNKKLDWKSRLDFLNTSQPANIPLSSENMTQGWAMEESFFQNDDEGERRKAGGSIATLALSFWTKQEV